MPTFRYDVICATCATGSAYDDPTTGRRRHIAAGCDPDGITVRDTWDYSAHRTEQSDASDASYEAWKAAGKPLGSAPDGGKMTATERLAKAARDRHARLNGFTVLEPEKERRDDARPATHGSANAPADATRRTSEDDRAARRRGESIAGLRAGAAQSERQADRVQRVAPSFAERLRQNAAEARFQADDDERRPLSDWEGRTRRQIFRDGVLSFRDGFRDGARVFRSGLAGDDADNDGYSRHGEAGPVNVRRHPRRLPDGRTVPVTAHTRRRR